MKKEQRLLVKPLKNFLKKEGKNDPVTEFRIAGGWIDVINYSKKDKVFDIVECKWANNAVKIGQAFGQVLAYRGIIENDGRRFFKEVLERARDWLTYEQKYKIFTEKNVRIRLYACFAEENVRKHQRTLEVVRNETKGKIGLILIHRGHVTVFQPADILTLSIRARYNKEEFYRELEEYVTHKIPEIRVLKPLPTLRVARFKFVHPRIHFEVWIRKREEGYTPIEIGLHLECDRGGRNKYVYEELLKRKKAIKKKLPNAAFQGWGKREWYRVCERYRFAGDTNRIDERDLNRLKGRLLTYIRTLRPMLKEIDWGKRKGLKRKK